MNEWMSYFVYLMLFALTIKFIYIIIIKGDNNKYIDG